MKSFYGLATAALLGTVGANFGDAVLSNHMMPARDYRNRGASKRRKTGKLYPHSNDRQHARYARQIAAGQLSMEGANHG